MWHWVILLLVGASSAKLDTEIADETGESDNAENDADDYSSERIGAFLTQITHHPYAASLLKNNTYVCSAIILNTYWLISDSNCFDSDVISSYVTHKNLKNYTIRVGSSYNNKGGSIHKIATMINNFDLKISAIKLKAALEFDSRVQAVTLPAYDEEEQIGHLANMIAWTPIGHMRVVNAPLVESSICEWKTKLLPGHYICAGGVQDVKRGKFCRKDNGGAIIQNNTLVGISTFTRHCAIYSRMHAFPKASSFARWIDSVIWDEYNRPTTSKLTTQGSTVKTVTINATEDPERDDRSPYVDPRRFNFMLTIPFEPINVPLEPAGYNSVLPRMSLYEAYLAKKARDKTSTTKNPSDAFEFELKNKFQKEWMKKYGNAVNSGVISPPQYFQNRRRFDMNGFINENKQQIMQTRKYGHK